MSRLSRVFLSVLLAAALLSFGCAPKVTGVAGAPADRVTQRDRSARGAALEVAAESERQWTGVAVTRGGRMFVNYPRWSDHVPFSLGEVTGPRDVVPYPDEEWNRWDPSLDPQEHFVCVQSVYLDDDEMLWVLDPANPGFQGVVPGGPKLVQIDPRSDQVQKVIPFGPDVAPQDSYLNDVRVDSVRKVAYITDSGTGALVVVDLLNGRSRRLLSEHPSTRSEGIVLTLDGRPWLRNEKAPQIHVDGIGLDPEREYLYYQALSGRHLYRIPTRWLRDEYLPPEALGEKVETVGETGPADGIMFDESGNLYLSALEQNAVRVLKRDGTLTTLLKDKRLRWPDSFAIVPGGDGYVTTSQISYGDDPPGPYLIVRFATLAQEER